MFLLPFKRNDFFLCKKGKHLSVRTFLEVEPSIEVQEQRKTRHPLTEKNIPPFYDHDIIGLLCIASMFDPCYDIVLAFWKNIIMLNVISTIFSLFITSGLFSCSGSKHSGAEFAHDPSRFYTHNGQIFGYCSGVLFFLPLFREKDGRLMVTR